MKHPYKVVPLPSYKQVIIPLTRDISTINHIVIGLINHPLADELGHQLVQSSWGLPPLKRQKGLQRCLSIVQFWLRSYRNLQIMVRSHGFSRSVCLKNKQHTWQSFNPIFFSDSVRSLFSMVINPPSFRDSFRRPRPWRPNMAKTIRLQLKNEAIVACRWGDMSCDISNLVGGLVAMFGIFPYIGLLIIPID